METIERKKRKWTRKAIIGEIHELWMYPFSFRRTVYHAFEMSVIYTSLYAILLLTFLLAVDHLISLNQSEYSFILLIAFLVDFLSVVSTDFVHYIFLEERMLFQSWHLSEKCWFFFYSKIFLGLNQYMSTVFSVCYFKSIFFNIMFLSPNQYYDNTTIFKSPCLYSRWMKLVTYL